MKRTASILGVAAAVLILLGSASAQVIGGNVGGKGGKTKAGPTDTVGPGVPPPGGGTPPEPEPEPWNPPGVTSVFPPPPSPPTGAAAPGVPIWAQAPDDDAEWLGWWRLQRWNRLEGPGPLEEAAVVTPGASSAPLLPPPGAPPGDPAALILPALLAGWAEQPGRAEMRAELVFAISRAGSGPEVGRVLREGLADDDLRVVEAAVLGLGVPGEPHAIPLLTELVRDTPRGAELLGRHEVPPRVRAFAAYALGLVAERTRYRGLRDTIADALVEGLDGRASATPDLGVACAAALGLFPATDALDRVPALLAVVRDRRAHRAVAASAAAATGKLLARAGDSRFARDVLHQLARTLDGDAVPSELRGSCALALGRIGRVPALAPAAVDPLLRRLHKDADPRVRHLAALGLAEIAAGSHPVAQTDALPALLTGVTDGPDRDRSWCALALGWAALQARAEGRVLPPVVGRRLLEAYPDRNRMRTRAAAALALGMLGHHPAEEALREALDEVGHPGLRAEVFAGLGLIAGAETLEELPAELARLDPLREEYQAACLSLARRAPDRLREVLVAGLDRSSATFEAEYAAALGLGWLAGDLAAVPPLLELWRGGRAPLETEVAAVRSLGRLAEPAELRWNAGYLDLVNPYAAPVTLIGSPDLPGICDRL